MQVIIQVQMFPTINAKVTLTHYKTTNTIGAYQCWLQITT